jgi:hypothetical protein
LGGNRRGRRGRLRMLRRLRRLRLRLRLRRRRRRKSKSRSVMICFVLFCFHNDRSSAEFIIRASRAAFQRVHGSDGAE